MPETTGIRIGCCGFPVAKAKYFKAFKVVELQHTFYQPPEDSVIKKWREESPADFEYTLKAWQLITHEPKSPTYKRLKIRIPPSKEKNYGSFKPTDEVFLAWERTKEIAEILRARVIIFQCPPSFIPVKENKENMKRFFTSIEKEEFILAWEPRGKWDDREIIAVCKEFNLIHVVDPFKTLPVYGKICYHRLHGIEGYKYKYTEEDLIRLEKLIKKELENVTDIYCMFNNVYMYEDAFAFKRLLMSR